MPILYDSKKIIPAPLISISQEIDRKGNSVKRRNVFSVTVTGTIHAFKGSPDSDGDFWDQSGYPPDDTPSDITRQRFIQAKIGALTSLFQTENKWFEAVPFDGSAALKFLARLKSMSFEAGPWYDTCKYTIVLECECIYFGDAEVCANTDESDPVDESWDIELLDENNNIYKLTHNLSAQFPNSYNNDGTLNQLGSSRAKSAVTAKFSPGVATTTIVQSGVLYLNLTDHQTYNHIRQVSQLDTEGIYRVTETWVCFPTGGSIPAIESYAIDINEQNGILTANISGNITGLFDRDEFFQISTTKLQRAQAKWAEIQPYIFSRAQSATERTLNPIPISRQKTQEITNGVITYSYQYNTRSNFGLTAMSVSVTVQDTYPSDVVASLTIINRVPGPLYQDIGTITGRQRTLTIDVVLNSINYDTIIPPTIPDVSAIVLYYIPQGYSQLFVTDHRDSYVLDQGRYSKTITWGFQ